MYVIVYCIVFMYYFNKLRKTFCKNTIDKHFFFPFLSSVFLGFSHSFAQALYSGR